MRTPGLIALALLVAGTAAAQDGTVSQSYRLLVKPGMELKFEEGWKRHSQWHKAQKDTWTWNVWQIMSGEQLGQYVAISGGHHWADFDKPGAPPDKDFQDGAVNISPFVEYTSAGFGALLVEASRPWPDTPQVPMVQVMDFLLNQGGVDAFRHAIRKFTEAAAKANWPGRYLWIERISGGETPLFTLVLPLANFAAMQPSGTSPDEMLESVWGRQESAALWEGLWGSVKSVTNSIWAHRRDLSYSPGMN